ncbi:MAG: hypothetical protein IJW26_03050 [Clostridia bacterium]|nr:hypothetical protein [Clostridia bacterium]
MESSIYEFSLQPKNPKLQKALTIIFDVLSILQIVFIFFLLYYFLFIELALVCLFSMLIFMLLRNCFYNFYDYTYVDGDFRIFKLVNNKYRKNIAIFDGRNIISVGKVGGETFNKYYKDNLTKRKFAKNRFKMSDNDIVVLLRQADKNLLLILENDSNYTSYLVRKAGYAKLDKDFIAYIKEGGLVNE